MSSIPLHPETAATATAVASAIDDKKGLEIVLLDVSGLLVITDVFAIATGTSRRHVKTLAEETVAQLKADDRRPIRSEGLDDASWVVLDYGDVVVHVFDQETRAYYDLERLWGDAPRLDFAPAGAPS